MCNVASVQQHSRPLSVTLTSTAWENASKSTLSALAEWRQTRVAMAELVDLYRGGRVTAAMNCGDSANIRPARNLLPVSFKWLESRK